MNLKSRPLYSCLSPVPASIIIEAGHLPMKKDMFCQPRKKPQCEDQARGCQHEELDVIQDWYIFMLRVPNERVLNMNLSAWWKEHGPDGKNSSSFRNQWSSKSWPSQ